MLVSHTTAANEYGGPEVEGTQLVSSWLRFEQYSQYFVQTTNYGGGRTWRASNAWPNTKCRTPYYSLTMSSTNVLHCSNSRSILGTVVTWHYYETALRDLELLHLARRAKAGLGSYAHGELSQAALAN